jgi:pimeloyl-ACP methyl ester carboxylesterase
MPHRPRWRQAIRILLRAYLLYLCLLFVCQRWLVFPGQFRTSQATDAAVESTGGQVWRLPSGGLAWWFPAAAGSPVLVVFHGNGELIDDWWPQSMDWRDQHGFSVLLVEYPGYGQSPGRPGRASLMTAANEALGRLRASTPARGPVIGLGASLGAAVAAELAAEGHFQSLVMLSPFTSMDAMAHRRLAPGFLLRDRFDNLAAVRAFSGRILVIHGKDDWQIPWSMGARVTAAAGGRATLLPLPGRGHNSLVDDECLAAINHWIAVETPGRMVPPK